MHEAPKDVRRRVVPRWRWLRATPRDELEFSTHQVPSPLKSELAGAAAVWSKAPSIESAAELLYLGSLGLASNAVADAAQFVLNSADAPASLRKLAVEVGPAILPKSQDVRDPLEIESAAQFQISRLRRQTIEYPRNALTHVELARAYCINGLREKANEQIRIALQLSPTSRYVLRSAARFDIHRGDFDRSWKLLERMAEHDPWTAATFVSFSDLSNRPIQSMRKIRALLDRDFHPSQISELAAALATLEAKNTSVKKARKYIQLCSVSPNENVIAQLYWLSRVYGIGFNQDLLKFEAHEAATIYAARHRSFRAAVAQCWNWFNEEPFSVRPAYEGGFIACEILQDAKIAHEFSFRGLQANPRDVGLLNNLAYSLLLDGDLPKAKVSLHRAKELNSNEKDAMILGATEGCLLYREGHAEAGARAYVDAILKAHELKMQFSKQLAFLHFCYEEVRIGHGVPLVTREQLEEFFNGATTDVMIKDVYNHLLVPILEAARQFGQPASQRISPEILFELAAPNDDGPSRTE